MPHWPVTNQFDPPSEPGIDYGTPIGTSLYAPVAGIARLLDTGTSGWGRSVQVGSYGAGHLSSFAVNNGQRVNKGQLIGYTGNSGNSTGPHVEIFSRNPGGNFINPQGIADAFFTPAPQTPTGSSSVASALGQAASRQLLAAGAGPRGLVVNPNGIPNPLNLNPGAALSTLGSDINAGGLTPSNPIAGLSGWANSAILIGEIILGVVIMLGGVAVLALMVLKGAAPATAKVGEAAAMLTPQGRAVKAISTVAPKPAAQAKPARPVSELGPKAQAAYGADPGLRAARDAQIAKRGGRAA